MTNRIEKELVIKKSNYNIRITTFVKGKVKNDFLDDCIRRGIGESQNAKQILKLYYKIMEANPSLASKEFIDIEKALINTLNR